MDTDILMIPCLFGLPRADGAALLSKGHINSTYAADIGGRRYILQSVNTSVFTDTKLLAANTLRAAGAVSRYGGLKVPEYRYSCDNEGSVWRIYPYIISDRVPSSYETGYAFGRFIRALDGEKPFVCAVQGFHDTAAVASAAQRAGADISFYREEDAEKLLSLPKRNIHGDARADNCVSADALVDIDTVMTHYAAYDYGDMVRSVCTDGIKELYPLTAGFAAGIDGLLSREEVHSLWYGIVCVTAELAMRYLTAAQGTGGLGKTPSECLMRADMLKGQLSVFRQNERYIRDIIADAFGL